MAGDLRQALDPVQMKVMGHLVNEEVPVPVFVLIDAHIESGIGIYRIQGYIQAVWAVFCIAVCCIAVAGEQDIDFFRWVIPGPRREHFIHIFSFFGDYNGELAERSRVGDSKIRTFNLEPFLTQVCFR